MPDIIHAEEEPDSLAALHVAACRRLLAPRARLVLFTWQNVDRPTRRAVHGVMRRTLAAADAVICGSQGAVARLRGLGFSRPTPVIPALALDASVFHPRPVPRSSDSFTVAFVGRLVPEKGIDTLLESVAAIGRPATLVVAGSGPCRAALERRAQALGIGGSVRFVGALEEAGVADVLNGADVLAVPSRSTSVWREQFGRVIVEAMGCGVPVVGSDCGAIPEVIGSSGFVFPEGDSGALADHLRRLRSSPQLRQEFGRRGRDWALASHDLSLRARQILDFYRELGRESPGGAR